MPEYLSVADAAARIDELCNNLTPKQRAFLMARRKTRSNKAALEETGITYATERNWLSKSPDYKEAYELTIFLTKASPNPVKALTVKQRNRLQEYSADLLEAMPEVIAEHLRLCLFADREADRLAAIKLTYEALDFKPETSMPISKQNQVFINILKMTAPQIAKEAEKRGLPMDVAYKDVVEGTFDELEGDLEEDEDE